MEFLFLHNNYYHLIEIKKLNKFFAKNYTNINLKLSRYRKKRISRFLEPGSFLILYNFT